jgi:hypothetical protein
MEGRFPAQRVAIEDEGRRREREQIPTSDFALKAKSAYSLIAVNHDGG